MQIEIDFEVFKTLTALRESEADSYNHVIRRLLNLPQAYPPVTPLDRAEILAAAPKLPKPIEFSEQEALLTPASILMGGARLSGVLLPEGTQFRATYKGAPYFAEIKNGKWVGRDGVVRTSPSHAASAITRTNVNGWRFWHVMRPGDTEWRRLDELKS